MNQYDWQRLYAVAMLEPHPTHRLITIAENAINARLQESLRGHPMAPQELQAAKDALNHLRLLKREVQGQKLTN
jgi:hypothetical protein